MKIIQNLFFILVAFGYHSTAVAQTAAASKVSTPSAAGLNTNQHLMTVLVALLGIIALIFIFAWFARRFNGGSWLKESHIKVLSSLPLGTRERLLLVEVGQQQLLLGVTANTISTLHTLQNPVKVPESSPPSEFAEKLLGMIDKKNTPMQTTQEVSTHEK